jgi:hypothetical protein
VKHLICIDENRIMKLTEIKSGEEGQEGVTEEMNWVKAHYMHVPQ